jgi:hypothetical protein
MKIASLFILQGKYPQIHKDEFFIHPKLFEAIWSNRELEIYFSNLQDTLKKKHRSVFENICRHGGSISFINSELTADLYSIIKTQEAWLREDIKEEGTMPSFRDIQMNAHKAGIR